MGNLTLCKAAFSGRITMNANVSGVNNLAGRTNCNPAVGCQYIVLGAGVKRTVLKLGSRFVCYKNAASFTVMDVAFIKRNNAAFVNIDKISVSSVK